MIGIFYLLLCIRASITTLDIIQKIFILLLLCKLIFRLLFTLNLIGHRRYLNQNTLIIVYLEFIYYSSKIMKPIIISAQMDMVRLCVSLEKTWSLNRLN